MKINLKYISSVLMFLLSAASFAAPVATPEAVDPQAKNLLDQAVKNYGEKQAIEVRFNIAIENTQNGDKDNMKGDMVMKGSKFRFSVNGIDTYFDGKTEYVYVNKTNEVSVSEPDEDQLRTVNPIFIIRSYSEGYKMLYIGTDRVDGMVIDIVDLFPEDRRSPYARITVSIDQKTKMLKAIRAQGKNGVHTIIEITSQKQAQVKDSDFVFDTAAHKGVEVIDLR